MKQVIKLYSLLILTTFFVGCSSDDAPKTEEVRASYTFVREAFPGRITFINTSSNADTYLWNFGDGTTSTLKDPVKTFAATGEYVVNLTASNSRKGTSASFSSTVSIFIFQGGLVINGDFESSTTGWFLGVDNPLPAGLLTTQDGNTFFSINVAAAGNPFDVNLSQTGIAMTQGVTYRLTFDAWSDVNRSVLAGIGLSGPPWTNLTQVVNLTSSMQSFSLDFTANFNSPNSRVLFDLGAAVGRVNIDNVTLNALP